MTLLQKRKLRLIGKRIIRNDKKLKLYILKIVILTYVCHDAFKTQLYIRKGTLKPSFVT